MLKKLSKSFLKRLVLIKLVLITVVVSLFISVKGPELHHSYLRSVVASKVVYVFSDSSGRGGGTGFFIKTKSGKFKVLTNKHICESSKDKQFLYIKEEGEPISRPYRIYVMDEKHDLCLVDYDKEVPVLSFASSIDVGEIVALIGHPRLVPVSIQKGENLGEQDIQIVKLMNEPEIKSCKGELIGPDIFIWFFYGKPYACVETFSTNHITTISYGGNSGSPVVNFWGNIVGVLFAGNPRAITESFMVPLKDIKLFINKY